MIIGKTYYSETLLGLYEQFVPELLEDGDIVSPRGQETRELISPKFVLLNPRNRLIHNKNRSFNIFHALNEAIQLFNKSDKVKHIAEFNKNMAKFSDDGKTMYGSYGNRIAYYIAEIVRKLREDPDSRQAVLTIHKAEDLTAQTKDVPCTQSLQFFIRDNALHCEARMRSNDAIFGFQYDVFMFSMLQETIANELRLPLGVYIHTPLSFHVYREAFGLNGYEALEEIASENSMNIKVANNGRLKDWFHLAYLHNSDLKWNRDEYSRDSTTAEIAWLMDKERKRRWLKDGKGTASDLYITFSLVSAYSNAPQWAKPFMDNFNK